MKQRQIVDTHKFLTAFVILLLMALYRRWDNTTAWIYLALHGTYGMLWLVKSRFFPDKRWERVVDLPNAVGLFVTLALYWIAPWIIVSQDVQAPAWYMALCVSIYSTGIFLHYASDMQKHMALSLNPNHLLKDGLWSVVRNPNYLGELLIYCGFGCLAMHWLPIAIMAGVIVVIWLPNMAQKDKSLARYSDFGDYKRQTKRILPFLY